MKASAQAITIAATINAPIDKVWTLWTTPTDIMQWNNASDDWHTPFAFNDLRKGGSFSSKMAAKDGSFAFDFWGVYDVVKTHKTIAYTLGDNRKVSITFTEKGNQTIVKETFDPEKENPVEMQQGGWQAILNNFKKYTEGVSEKVRPKIFINLPVKDVKKAMAFYTKIGFMNEPKFTDKSAACMFFSEEIFVMLLARTKFKVFTKKTVANTIKTASVINSLSLQSSVAMHALMENALAAGATEPSEARDYGFMQQRSFEDLDGHLWEVFYMDLSKMPQ